MQTEFVWYADAWHQYTENPNPHHTPEALSNTPSIPNAATGHLVCDPSGCFNPVVESDVGPAQDEQHDHWNQLIGESWSCSRIGLERCSSPDRVRCFVEEDLDSGWTVNSSESCRLGGSDLGARGSGPDQV